MLVGLSPEREGGQPMPAFAGGGFVDFPARSGNGSTINLTIGNETFKGLIAPSEVAEKMVRVLRGSAVRRIGKPRSSKG